MNPLMTLALTVVVFLLTYLLFSTVIVGVIGVASLKLKRFANPELRVLSWKLALVMPLATALAVTVFDVPHFGFQLPVSLATATDELTAVVTTTNRDLPDSVIPGQNDGTGLRANLPSHEIVLADSIPIADSTASIVSTSSFRPFMEWTSVLPLVVLSWLIILVVGYVRLGMQVWQLRRLRENAIPVQDLQICTSLKRLHRQMGIRGSVELRRSQNVNGPMTAGIFRSFILLPHDLRSNDVTSNETQNQLDASELDALLAHELVHIARRDAAWNLIIQILGRTFPFQPLNWFAGRQLRKEMDFVADSLAAQTLGERTGLARCLLKLGNQLSQNRSNVARDSALAACMASFHSTLGQRVEVLLNDEHNLRPLTRSNRLAVMVLLMAGAFLATSVTPRVIAQTSKNSPPTVTDLPPRNEAMNQPLSALAILVGLALPATADEPQEKAAPKVAVASELKSTPDALPKGMQRFNGMLVGRLAAKDVEKGTFVVQVDAVPRVWQNSKAEDPKSIVGKSTEVTGVFGKFLDVLVVTRIGETLEFECKHDGDRLVFPGELLRKVAPYDAAVYPELPEEFRGFRGAIVADVVKKDPETFELIVKVNRVSDTWKENAAKEPKSIEGKQLMLAGFWNRKDAYHKLKVGDQVEVGVQHIGLRSDHLTVAEFVRTAGEAPDREMMKKEGEREVADGFTKELRGFRGMLVGRLVEKDVERGTFTITVDAVPRVWNNNKSSSPKSFLGTNVAAEGVTGKMLDALVVTRVGETLEFGALHDGGERMRVGEVLRKVSPVKPGDYPVLPDEFRGFRGMVSAKVIRKDDHLMDMVIEITEIKSSFDNSNAKDAKVIIGQQAMLAGFWNRKDAFHTINVGDTIECGVEHPQHLSDHLSVIESVKKIK